MRRELGGGDFGRRLSRQGELHAIEEQAQFGLGLGVAGENDLTSVGGRQMHVDHLHGGEFGEGATRRQARGEAAEPARERGLKTVGEESDEDVRFDSFVAVMEDWPDGEIALEGFERFFHGYELNEVLPEFGGIVVSQIGPQRIMAFAASDLSSFLRSSE